MHTAALKELLYKMADDQLIMGHRNSEWTGMGPLLEEDIAFSSMAQDKVGQSLALYQLLQGLGEGDPDTVAFTRNADQFHNTILSELPNGDYDFSLVRHFLFDTAEALRFSMLSESSYEPLAQLSRKIRGELRYHTMHARTWMQQLGSATPESTARLQRSLNEALPYALGIFEHSPFEQALIDEKIFGGEDVLKKKWQDSVASTLRGTALQLPEWSTITPVLGGRVGRHSEHLQPLLTEMGEVFRIDPQAEW